MHYDICTSKFLTLLLTSILSFSIHAETIHVATGEYPPWTSESLPYGGYVNHIVSNAFALSDIQVEFHYMPWKRALEATRIGKFNASSFWAENLEREKEFLRSEVVNNAPFVFFYRKENTDFMWSKLSDLKQYKIGATRAYTYTKEFWHLTEQNKLRVSIANDDTHNLRKLVSGQIDIFPISELTGKYLLKKHFNEVQQSQIVIHNKPLSIGKDFILFSKKIDNNNKYLNIFNLGLKHLQENNTLEEFQHELSE